MPGFQWLEFIHIVSATILFGTGLGTAFFMWRAYTSGDARVMASVGRSVVKADWWFTTPAVIVQPVTGFLMLNFIAYETYPLWIIAALILYALIGCCWLPVVWIQIKLVGLAQHAVEQNREVGPDYHRYMKAWFALGWPAFISVLVIYYLMVFKPS